METKSYETTCRRFVTIISQFHGWSIQTNECDMFIFGCLLRPLPPYVLFETI